MIPSNTQIWLVAGITDMRRGYTEKGGFQWPLISSTESNWQ
jgi:hypothetical protein